MRRNWWIERQEEQDGTLKFHSALGDLDAVRTSLDENGNGLTAVNEAFMCACRFEHLAVASVLLERSMALDAELGKNVDGAWAGTEAGLYAEAAPAAPGTGLDEALAHRWHHHRAGVEQQLCARHTGEDLFSVRVEGVTVGARSEFRADRRHDRCFAKKATSDTQPTVASGVRRRCRE